MTSARVEQRLTKKTQEMDGKMAKVLVTLATRLGSLKNA